MPRLNKKIHTFIVIAFMLAIAVSVNLAAPAPDTDPCQTPYFKRVSAVYLGSFLHQLFRKAHLADFNNDSKQDLIVLQENPKTVSILLGQGTGGFGAPVSYSVGAPNSNLTDVKSGDFNGDGQRDLIVFSSGDSQPPFFNCASSISVLFGNGAGGFATPVTYGVQLCNRDVSTADFNNDGKSDIVLGSYPAISPGAERLLVGLGEGSGTFAGTTIYDVGGVPSTWAVADFNGDNRPDLAVGKYDAQTFLDQKTVILLSPSGRVKTLALRRRLQ